MKPKHRLIVVAAGLAAVLARAAIAVQHSSTAEWPDYAAILADGPPPKTIRAEAQPSAGKVLLLDNGRAIDGDIERVGDGYRLKRGEGEQLIGARQVLRLCADWDDALAFMESRANLMDPAERVRLAQWCQKHGLAELALMETAAALKLSPGHGPARQLQALLEKTLEAKASGPAATPAPVQPALPAYDLAAESFTQFNQRVQPILLNTCSSCHSNGRGGNFQLSRAFESGPRAAAQRNLASTLAYVNFERPASSMLLVKALSDHGGVGKSPVPGRQSIPFRTLEGWLHEMVAANPHLRDQAMQASASRPPLRSDSGFAEPALPLLSPPAPPPSPTGPASSPLARPPEPASPAATPPPPPPPPPHGGVPAPTTTTAPAPVIGVAATSGSPQTSTAPLAFASELRPVALAPVTTAPVPVQQKAPAGPEVPATGGPMTLSQMAATGAPRVLPASAFASGSPATPRGPEGSSTPDDPFDAEAFNRLVHPTR